MLEIFTRKRRPIFLRALMFFSVVGSGNAAFSQAADQPADNAANPFEKTFTSTEERSLYIETMSWGNSKNAAGLGLEEIRKSGKSNFSTNFGQGDFRLSQDGDGRNSFMFHSDRFDKINDRILVWGSFDFDMSREKNRAWSDVFHKLNTTPFIFGSGIPGSYDSQLFDFEGKISWITTSKLNLGVGFDYLVGDLSRLKDPRSRSYLADYAVKPSATYALSEKHAVGAFYDFGYQKEKMPNVTTVQEAPDYKYYFILGLENGEEPLLNPNLESGMGWLRGFVGFKRQFVATSHGFGLQHSYKSGNIKWFTSASWKKMHQNIWGDIKKSPGEYLKTTIDFSSKLISSNSRFVQTVELAALLTDAYTNEFLQERRTSLDPVTGIESIWYETIKTYEDQYKESTQNIALNYGLFRKNASQKGYLWHLGFMVKSEGFSKQYTMTNSSFDVQKLYTELRGEYSILNKSNKNLMLKVKGGVSLPMVSDLDLKNTKNDLAQNIYMPDQKYYDTMYYTCYGELCYNFPIKLKKNQYLFGFAKAFTNNMLSDGNGKWQSVGFSVGIMTH